MTCHVSVGAKDIARANGGGGEKTVANFTTIDPDYIMSMDHTGELFIQEALRVMPQKAVRPCIGMELVFAA
jgi:7,8-dihydropterin-6-yl-methyl-4-(beta-D-ribofuranosyl)aminobenzene 5'-phosphate synthase